MLHILNGRSTEDTLRESAVPGEFFSFRDALIVGPTPHGLDENGWRRTRAAHLSESYGIDGVDCEKDLMIQSVTLASFESHEEVVLWFEHDLFCQINLLYLLNWFGAVHLGHTKLSLVNIGSFPGREKFRGLGELSADELASLFPKRQPVSATEVQLASAAWEAFCSPRPTSIDELLQGETSALPFLAPALSAHLRRFPSTRNGLGQIENNSLQLIERGLEKFTDLFPGFIAAQPIYGLGDNQLWLALRKLVHAKAPLITTQNGNAAAPSAKQFPQKTAFKLTDIGRAVLEGEADFLKLNEMDEWLGGVHLNGSNQLWRWDEQAGKLKYC